MSFSATPPPNPVRGHFWWDGTVLHLFDGAAWVDIGPSASGAGSTGKTTITFAMQQNTAMTVPTSVWGILPFSAVPIVDIQGAWDPVTHRLTPKVAGNYLFDLRGVTLGTSGGMAILKNDPGTFTGTDPAQIVVALSGSAAQSWMTSIGVAQMNGTTDFVRAWGFEQTGSFPALASAPAFSGVIFP